ncbi:MAG: DUF3857 domain-containing protein [Desulfomonilia bacterium]
MNIARLRLVLVFTVLFISGVIGFSELRAQTWEPLDREETIQQAGTITPDMYPNSDVVQLNQQTWVRYRDDGTFIEWYEAYIKILTEKGRRRYQTIPSSFTIPYNTTMFTRVEIIRADGSVHSVDIEKNSREMVEQSQIQSNIFNPNDRVLQVSIPELDVGDTVHVIIFDEFTKARMPGSWSDFTTFEGTDPIIQSVYTVVAPADKPLRSIALKAEIPGTVTRMEHRSAGEMVYTWTARNVPRAYEEPEMPPLHTQVQRLLVSTIPDWETVSQWYWNLSWPHIERTTPEMRKTVDHLTSGSSDAREKIESIFRWVSQEIRYLGITVEQEAPGYEPHDVDMTFERKAGVCRDKAALLVAMLRLAGFEAYPVLIMNGPKKDPEVPQPFFNHAISCVRMENGDYLLMDATDENTKELFPSYLNNQSYLVATPQGETLLTSPISPARDNMMSILTEGHLDENGTLTAASDLIFEGINDNAYRGYFSRLNPIERQRYFEMIVKRAAPGARMDRLEITPENLTDTSLPLKASIRFRADNILIRGQGTVMLPLIRLGERIGVVNFLAQKTGLKERKYPYVTEIACGVNETIRLHISESLGEPSSLPNVEDVETPGTTWRRSLAVSDSVLEYENIFTMNLPEYSPDEYQELKKALARIESEDRKMPIFTSENKAQEGRGTPWFMQYNPDAVVLTDETVVDVIDEHTWTETHYRKMLIRTYAGKKLYSDLKIPFNPVWEDVDVVHAEVVSPSGMRKKVQEQEINIMDEEWVGSAPRYPPGKILVMSLPGVVEGSVLEYTVIHTKKHRPSFFLMTEFRETNPIESKEIRISTPDHIPLRMSSSDSGFGLPGKDKTSDAVIEHTRKHSEGKVLSIFRVRNVAPMKKEHYLPPGFTFNPVVIASSIDLDGYTRTANETLIRSSSFGADIQSLVGTLLEGTESELEKIRRLRDFVARNVRLVDMDFSSLPLDVVSTARQTIMDGYGNSADRAVVLHSLLKTAGFEPNFVLVPDVPPGEGIRDTIRNHAAHEWFTLVLVLVNVRGQQIYLGDTDQYAAIGTTPHDGLSGLFLDKGELGTISVEPEGMRDRIDEHYELNLEPDGTVLLKKRRMYFGMEYARFHKMVREMTPEERTRHFQETVSGLAKIAEPVSEYHTEYSSYPGIEEYTVRISSYAPRQDEYLYLELPGLDQQVTGAETDTRENPLFRDTDVRGRITVEVHVPQGVKSMDVHPPEDLSYTLVRSGIIRQDTAIVYWGEDPTKHVTPGSLVVTREVDFVPVVILPHEYEQLLEIQKVFTHPGNRMVLLKMN